MSGPGQGERGPVDSSGVEPPCICAGVERGGGTEGWIGR
jgi:hypothetical protein